MQGEVSPIWWNEEKAQGTLYFKKLVKYYANLKVDYKGYKVESKYFNDSNLSRHIVMLKSDITYERLTSLENDKNSKIILKAKISNNKCIHIVNVYSQLTLLKSNANSPESQMKFLKQQKISWI